MGTNIKDDFSNDSTPTLIMTTDQVIIKLLKFYSL